MTTMTSDPEVRSETPPPTEDGWFYGSLKGSSLNPIPMPVIYFSGNGEFMTWNMQWRPIDDFRWYGPVPTVKAGE